MYNLSARLAAAKQREYALFLTAGPRPTLEDAVLLAALVTERRLLQALWLLPRSLGGEAGGASRLGWGQNQPYRM